MSHFIYKLTCRSNGKGYIGATNNPRKRLSGHRFDAAHGSMSPIHKAIRKYGIENFDMTILFEGLDRDVVFNTMEPKLILEHRTDSPDYGYNVAPGGEGVRVRVGYRHSEATKEKMRKAQIGRSKSEAHKAAMRSAKTSPEYKKKVKSILLGNQRSVGYHHTPEARQAIRVARLGTVFSESTRQNMSIAAKNRAGNK
jgi:group I intron endonuclease